MRTNNMIYQAAVAHQTDLRRTAARYAQAPDRSSGRASWIHLFSVVRDRQGQTRAATPAATLTASPQARALTRSLSV